MSILDQAKICPFCAKENNAEAAICRFCGSDLSSLRSQMPPGSQPRRKHGRRGLEFLVYLTAACLLVYLSQFLPEGVREWHDWFFLGNGRSFLFTPCTILVLLYLVTGWLFVLRYRGRR